MNTHYLRPFFATIFMAFLIILGFDCAANADHMELVAPIQEKGGAVIDIITSVFSVIATITIVIGVVGLATPFIHDKAAFFKTVAFVFLASILIANLDVVKAIIGLS